MKNFLPYILFSNWAGNIPSYDRVNCAIIGPKVTALHHVFVLNNQLTNWAGCPSICLTATLTWPTRT